MVVFFRTDISTIYQGTRQGLKAHKWGGNGIRLLICVLNDGAYGAEVHKLVPAGVDPGEAIFGRTDLAAVSRGFQLAGHTVTDLGNLKSLLEQYAASGKATLLDIPVSREVPSQQYRRLFWGET